MESINKAEILGRVGSIKVEDVNGLRMARMTVYTEYAYKTEGGVNAERDWHYVTAWNGNGIADVETIYTGAVVHITGRMRTRAYVSSDGSEGRMTDILAHTLKIIEGNE